MYINNRRIRSIQALHEFFDFPLIWNQLKNSAGLRSLLSQIKHDDKLMDDQSSVRLDTLLELTAVPKPTELLCGREWFTFDPCTGAYKPTVKLHSEEALPEQYVGKRVVPPHLRMEYNLFLNQNAFSPDSAWSLMRFLFLHDLAQRKVTPEAWRIFVQETEAHNQQSGWLLQNSYAVLAADTENGEIRLPALNMNEPDTGADAPLTVVRFTAARYGETIRFRLGGTPICRSIRRGGALYAVRKGQLGYTGFLDLLPEEQAAAEWRLGSIIMRYPAASSVPFSNCLMPVSASDGKTVFISWNNKLCIAEGAMLREVKGTSQSVILDACECRGRYAWINDQGGVFTGEQFYEKAGASSIALCENRCAWISDDKCFSDQKPLNAGRAVTALSRTCSRLTAIDRCGGTNEWSI